MGTFKLRQRTKDKYDYFLRLGRNEVRPLPADRVPYDAHGVTAEECFHQLESGGKCGYCREPDALEHYLAGKELHGITVKAVAEDFVVSRVVTSLEIRQTYPEWVANEIFQQAKKTAVAMLGFTPSFVRDSRDWSEMPQWEFNQKMRPILATMVKA